MPLSLAVKGEEHIIKRIGGKDEIKSFLGNLGFVVGASVVVLSEFGGNLIVLIKNSKIAIAKDMAKKIIV